MAAGIPILSALAPNIRLLVEIAWGADLTDVTGASWTWADISQDLRYNQGQSVVISVGRADERSTASPASCSFVVNNNGGAYTPYNPLSSNWPNVRRNTPVRVRASLDGGTTWVLRFQGYATGFNPAWDESTRDAVVTVSASGISRRLAQGKTPLHSALYRTIINDSPLAYWPLEDGKNSTRGASPISGVTAMDRSGIHTYPDFAGVNTIPGSDALPNFNNGGVLAAPVVGGTAGATGWTVEFVLDVGSSPGSDTAFILVEIPTTKEDFTVIGDITNSQYQVEYTAKDTLTGPTTNIPWASTVSPFDGNPHLVQVAAQQAGANVTWSLTISSAAGVALTTAGTVTSRTLGSVSSVILGAQPQSFPYALGHLSVWNGYLSPPWHYDAMVGHPGETPGARMTRLSAEQGVPFSIVGFYNTTQAMGPQGVDTYVNLMRDCEATDAGFLYDGLSGGFQYQGISQRYDQASGVTLAAGPDLRYPFLPIDDDQRAVNFVKASRTNGSFAIAEDTTGPRGTTAIGTYDTQVTINSRDDSGLFDRAAWEVHAGTVDGFRYPTMSMSMLTNPTLLSRWLNRTDGFSGPVVPGCRVDVTGVSAVLTQHPAETVSQVLEGYRETISNVDWQVEATCSQNRVYDVFKIGDPQLGRIDTDGSTLALGASAGATSLSVATTGGFPLWTTTAAYPTDFPLYVEIDGIQVTVTGISGTTSPQTFTVDGSTVTKNLSSGKSVAVWHPGVLAL